MRAQSKSSILSSIIYELSPLVQTKRRRDNIKGEVAGKRIEAVSGWIAKHIALIPLVLFAELVTQPDVERNEQVPEHLMWIQYILLIVGFSFRKELEIVGRVLSGLVFGMKDVINDCRGLPDGEETEDVTTEIPREHFGDMGDGEGDGAHDERIMASYRSKNLTGEQPDDDEDGSGVEMFSKAVSLNSPASSPDSHGNGNESHLTPGSRFGGGIAPPASRFGKKLPDDNDNDNDRDNPPLANRKERYGQKRSSASDQTPVNTVSTAKRQGPPGSDDGQGHDVVVNMQDLISTAAPGTTGTGRSGTSFERKSRVSDISGRSSRSPSSESPSVVTNSDSSATRSYPSSSRCSTEESDSSGSHSTEEPDSSD
jgi:hypothetical protein